MAITYTESWDQSFNDTKDDRDVAVTLHVVSDAAVLNGSNVLTATHATSGAAFPSKGDAWPNNFRYRLHSRRAASFSGPRYAKVQLIYKTGPFGGEEATDDPLQAPVRYRWRPITQGEPTDIDIDGNPIINSAGDPFANPVQGFLNSYILEATRNEAGFNQQQAVMFQNAINSTAIQFGGSTIEAGEAKCTGIYPANDFTLVDEYVPVTYQFEIRERLTLGDGRRITSFVHRILDQGRQAWLYDGSKVPIYNRNGTIANPTPVTRDVPLDRGVPIGEPGDGGETYYSVEVNFNPPDRGWSDNPQESNKVNEPPLLAIDKDPDSGITFLYYKKHKELNFASLGL